jgi:hypothetical protein
MAFTYTDTLATNRDKIRFYLQDTVENSGPKPSDGNFSDAEIAGLVTAEGSWQKAVAAGYEVLAAAWAGYADWQAGPRRESASQIADRWAALAEEWRDRHGASATGAGTRHPTRVDGYSDDVSSEET